MQVDGEHIRALVEGGNANVIPVEQISGFSKFLGSQRWAEGGVRLDWSDVRHVVAKLSEMTEHQLTDWIRTTALGRHGHIVFWFDENQPGVACRTSFAAIALDQIFWKAPGVRYMFGASLSTAKFFPCFEDYAEYDGADGLVARSC